MRDLGSTHTIPNLSALPGSGVAGQVCRVSNITYYWNTTFGAWMPLDEGEFYSPLAANYTNATTTLSSLFTFAAVANAVYEIDMWGIWQGSATTVAMKLALVTPTSAVQQMLCEVSGTQAGVVTPTFLELGTSGTAQTGPVPATASAPMMFTGRGLVSIGATAGSVTVQAAASATGTLTVLKGSRLRYKRLV